jgi:molybdopterin synthase catalytic subunit
MHARLADARAGAVVVFAGTVREFTRGRQTLFLEYEAYERMADAKLRAVRDACMQRWPLCRAALWHRVGRLELTEISVLVGAASPHRKDAFAAAQYAIDTLKQTVPIWKRETWSGGSDWASCSREITEVYDAPR